VALAALPGSTAPLAWEWALGSALASGAFSLWGWSGVVVAGAGLGGLGLAVWALRRR